MSKKEFTKDSTINYDGRDWEIYTIIDTLNGYTSKDYYITRSDYGRMEMVVGFEPEQDDRDAAANAIIAWLEANKDDEFWS